MDLMLMLRGDARWCADCAAETIFVPVVDPGAGGERGTETSEALEALAAWCCTACDAAVVLAPCSVAHPAPWAA